MRIIQFVFLLVLSALVISSCEQERNPCFEPTINPMRFHTYRAFEGDTGIVAVDSALPSARLFSIDNNQLFSQENKNQSMALWLSPHADSTRYSILPDIDKEFINGFPATDTLTIYYERVLHFISPACGYTYYFNLKNIRATTNSLDSVVIANGAVTNNVNIEHVKIYY